MLGREIIMNKFIVFISVILIFDSLAEIKQFYLDKDTVTYQESELIWDEDYGPEKGDKLLTWENRSVQYIKYGYSSENTRYIFKVIKHSKEIENIEGMRCELLIKAYKKANNFVEKIKYNKIWEINNNDCSARLDETHTFLATINYGCCGAEDVRTYYTLAEGKKISASTSDVHRIPNTDLSVIYHGDHGATFIKADKKVKGIIYLLDYKKVLDKIFVATKDESSDIDFWTPKIKTNFDEYLHRKEKMFTLKYYDCTYKFLVVNRKMKILKSGKNNFYK